MALPDMEKAAPALAGATISKYSRLGGTTFQTDTNFPCPRQCALFTAAPSGKFWQVKAIASSGETVRLGVFPNRRTALQAASLMAQIARARFLP